MARHARPEGRVGVAGAAVELDHEPAPATRCSTRTSTVSANMGGICCTGQSSGPGTSGNATHVPDRSRSWLPRAALTVSTSSVAESADGPALGGVAADGGEDDLPVEHRPRGRVGEVLGRGPHRRPPRGLFEGHDARRQAASAVEEASRGAHGRGDREAPAQRVVGRLEPEEVPCVHQPHPNDAPPAPAKRNPSR